MSVKVSLHGMLRRIRVDTLRRDHNVCFLVGRLILCIRDLDGTNIVTILTNSRSICDLPFHDIYGMITKIRWRILKM